MPDHVADHAGEQRARDESARDESARDASAQDAAAASERERPAPELAPSEPAHRDNRPARPVPRTPGRHRRVTTDPPPGSDPTPSPEPPRHASTENDEQLKRDKPPHWG